MKERDTLIDNLRALSMIHIVCIIHVMFWLGAGSEFAKSVLLFEMPSMFFIAGASQYLSGKGRSLKTMLTSRTRRLLLPFCAFLPCLYVWMCLMTFIFPYCGIDCHEFRALNTIDVVKTVLTMGSDKIPFYGYTWFISVYMLISLSLPLQDKLLKHTNRYVYISVCILIVVLFSYMDFRAANLFVRNVAVYNFFYMAGYLFYRNIPKNVLSACCILAVTVTVYGFSTGILIPMQDHKFPADWWFLVFGTAWISLLSIFFKGFKSGGCRLLDIWNRQGYNIYLCQSISFCIVVALTNRWVPFIDSLSIRFGIYFTVCLLLNTLLGYMIPLIFRSRSSKIRKHP